MFKYKSDLVLSKSWLNRALIIQSYAPNLKLGLDSNAEDVRVLKKAISEIGSTNEFYLGQGGTSLRFFCLLISRRPGNWIIKAHPRLLERPQSGLSNLFGQLGVGIKMKSDRILIDSTGWKIPEEIICEAKDSSQFVSALLLNSWKLERDLNLKILGPIVSEDYLTMTIKLLENFGMKINQGEFIQVPAAQKPQDFGIKPEVDVSSAFSLAAAAVIDGDIEITNWSPQALQPDLIFLKIFDQMNIGYTETLHSLSIKKQKTWKAVNVNLVRSPDLFPVLAVLCALAEGTSHLHGAEQLKHKESDRLAKTKELLDLAGFRSEFKSDGLSITGQSSFQDKTKKLKFDPDHDHRMAMAAGVLKLAGYDIDIQCPEVVTKSYSAFWKDVGLSP